MKKIYLAALMIIALAFMVMPSTAQANLLVSPGFEDSGGAVLVGWTTSGGARAIDIWHTPHGGTWMAAMWDGGAATGEAYQELSITADQAYTFSIWGAKDNNNPETGDDYMALRWYAGESLLTTDSQNLSLVNEWTQGTLNVTAPATATKVQVAFGSVDPVVTSFFDDADFDVTGAPIPEPATILSLGTGLVGLFAIRRKKRG